MIVLSWAERDEEFDVAVELIARYLDELGEDLGFQAPDASAEALRRHYPAPGGVLLAQEDTRPVGVVAVRELGAGRFELKRLWVDPDHRGRGVGRALVGAVLGRVEAVGGVEVVLDTLDASRPRSLSTTRLASTSSSPTRTTHCPARSFLANSSRRHGVGTRARKGRGPERPRGSPCRRSVRTALSACSRPSVSTLGEADPRTHSLSHEGDRRRRSHHHDDRRDAWHRPDEGMSTTPDPEMPERAKGPRRFSAASKARILAEYDTLAKADKGALLRREGLYSSLITEWLRQRDHGIAEALSRAPGRQPADPRDQEIAHLKRHTESLERRTERL